MLKKIVLTLAMVAFAANAFAASAYVFPIPSTIAFVPSKSVTLGYQAAAPTGGGNKAMYTIGAKNTAGDKIYATTSASTAIVWKAGLAGATLAATDGTSIPTEVSDSRIDSGFSVL